MWSPSTLFLHLHLLHSPSFPQVPPTHAVAIPILQSCLSLLILKSVFKGVSHCILAVNVLTLVSSIPSVTLPYPFPPTPHYLAVVCIVVSSIYLGSSILILLTIILFSFPSSPELHSVFPLLPTYSTCRCGYDHVCFVYMFIFCIYLPHMRENMWPLSFWTWLT
jgi:hypothetical protein